jgi:hypothetical protein
MDSNKEYQKLKQEPSAVQREVARDFWSLEVYVGGVNSEQNKTYRANRLHSMIYGRVNYKIEELFGLAKAYITYKDHQNFVENDQS